MMKNLWFGLGLLAASTTAAAQEATEDEGSDHKVRFQTHFHKPLSDGGLGFGGWVVLPDVIGMSTSTLFLMGPHYEGEGWWIEGLAGGMMTAGDPISHPWSLSGRVELMPEALGAPLRFWGNLQLNDVTGNLQPYTLLMADYAALDGQVFVGLESENHINLEVPTADGTGTETINDFSVGPHMMVPFDGLRVTVSVQIHPEERIRNQFWLRIMYDFGPVGD